MSFAIDLRSYLVSRGPVTSQVGTRVYLERADVGAALPYIVISQDGSDPTYSLTGETGTVSDLYEITGYASTALAADAVCDGLRACLSGYRGAMGSEQRTDARIQDRFSGYEPPDDGSDRGAYYCTLRVEIVHSTALPTAVPTP